MCLNFSDLVKSVKKKIKFRKMLISKIHSYSSKQRHSPTCSYFFNYFIQPSVNNSYTSFFTDVFAHLTISTCGVEYICTNKVKYHTLRSFHESSFFNVLYWAAIIKQPK